jgi:hypothetical protein
MWRRLLTVCLCGFACLSDNLRGDESEPLKEALAVPLLAPGQNLREIQDFTGSRIPPLPTVTTREA